MRSNVRYRRAALAGLLPLALGGCVQVWVPDPYAAYGAGPAASAQVSAAQAGAIIGAAMGAAMAAGLPPEPPVAPVWPVAPGFERFP